jgi:hypothetical protein
MAVASVSRSCTRRGFFRAEGTRRNLPGERLVPISELIRNATHGGVLPVLDLDPMVTPAAAIGALAMLRDQALQPHPTGRLEQIGADLALLEGRDEDRLCPPRLTVNPDGALIEAMNQMLRMQVMILVFRFASLRSAALIFAGVKAFGMVI